MNEVRVHLRQRSAQVRKVALTLLCLGAIGCAHRQTFPGNRIYAVPGTKSDVVVYRDFGPADAALTVIMLHGAGVTKIMWKEAEARLSYRYRTICLDFPGHGESSKHASRLPRRSAVPGGPYSLAAQAEFLRRFIADEQLAKDRRLVLVGASYGGGIALETYRLMSPEERDRVAGMFLLAPAAHFCRKPEGYPRGEQLASLLASPITEAFLRLFIWPTRSMAWNSVKRLYPDVSKVDRALLEEWLDDIVPIIGTPRQAYLAVRVNLDTYDELKHRAATNPDEFQRYSCVTCPVFVAWGSLDNVLDISILLHLREELPNCESRVFFGAGHEMLGLKDKAALEWLEEFVQKMSNAE